MAGWRFYARRAVSGLWLATDIELDADVTERLSAPGEIKAKIPVGLDRHLADDGLPLWLERSTKIYAELDSQLVGTFVCDYTGSDVDGRSIEAVGLPGALSWMPFDGELSLWRPDAADIVAAMVASVQARPNGNLGLQVRLAGGPLGKVGDEQPPAPPAKPAQRAGESDDAYDDRLLPWEEAIDAWEAAYKDRAPYEAAWYMATIVGDELDSLAKTTPFEWRERHRWLNRATLEAEHVLELGTTLGTRRTDIAFYDGVNLAERITPETDTTEYANDVIVLGSGEGPGMLRGRASTLDDGRLWSAKVVNAKDLTDATRLRSIAAAELAESRVSTKLADVKVWDTGSFAAVSTLHPGDEVWVESTFTTPPFAGWCPVMAVTRNTRQSHEVALQLGGGVTG